MAGSVQGQRPATSANVRGQPAGMKGRPGRMWSQPL